MSTGKSEPTELALVACSSSTAADGEGLLMKYRYEESLKHRVESNGSENTSLGSTVSSARTDELTLLITVPFCANLSQAETNVPATDLMFALFLFKAARSGSFRKMPCSEELLT